MIQLHKLICRILVQAAREGRVPGADGVSQKGPQEALPVWMARAQEVLIDVDLNHTTPLPTLNEAMLMLDAQRPQQRMGATD
jgi:hypothetical protein